MPEGVRAMRLAPPESAGGQRCSEHSPGHHKLGNADYAFFTLAAFRVEAKPRGATPSSLLLINFHRASFLDTA